MYYSLFNIHLYIRFFKIEIQWPVLQRLEQHPYYYFKKGKEDIKLPLYMMYTTPHVCKLHYISTPVYNVKIKTEHIETHTSKVDIDLTI